jgi:omega-6 fatty acid desaturase (delta-12 desaturase)
MIEQTTSPYPQACDEKAWLKILAKYRTPHAGRSTFELAVTAIPFAGFWTLSYVAVHYGFCSAWSWSSRRPDFCCGCL